MIKDNSVYTQVFSENYPINVYTNAGLMVRAVDRVLKSRAELTARDRTNIRFYVLFWFACGVTGKHAPKVNDVAKIDATALDEGEIESAADEVWKLYVSLGGDDQVAKGPELRKAVIEAVTLKY